MKLTLTALSFAALALTAPAFAQDASGDAAAGEKVFAKCQTCHVIADADGTVLGGKNAKVGPNLYGLPGALLALSKGSNTASPSWPWGRPDLLGMKLPLWSIRPIRRSS